MPYIYGRNLILDALQDRQPIEKIYIQYGQKGEKIRKINYLASQQEIPVAEANQKKIRHLVGEVNHQGIVALISPVKIQPLEILFSQITRLNSPILLVLLDRIQDPHNMGAIIRSAEILGANGLIYSSRENVSITDAVVKASAGAALHFPIYKANNLAQTVDLLKKKEIWVYGASLQSSISVWEVDFKRDCAIIIGGEEKGIRPILQKKCDQLFHIPQSGSTQSLNASVAAGVIFAESLRQRK